MTIPFGYLHCLDVLLPIVGYLESNVLARGGESIVEVYIFSPYIEKVCGIVVFGKFSCGTYVIVALNSDIVVFLNMQKFL